MDDTALHVLDRAALELLLQAIKLQHNISVADLAIATDMLQKYVDDPSPRRFSLAKMAFDDIDVDLRRKIRTDADHLATKTALDLRARQSLQAMTAKLTDGPRKDASPKSSVASPVPESTKPIAPEHDKRLVKQSKALLTSLHR